MNTVNYFNSSSEIGVRPPLAEALSKLGNNYNVNFNSKLSIFIVDSANNNLVKEISNQGSDLTISYVPKAIQSLLDDSDSIFGVASYEGLPCGFWNADKESDRLDSQLIYVLPNYRWRSEDRRKKIGKALKIHQILYAKWAGFPILSGRVSLGNSKSLRVHKGLGINGFERGSWWNYNIQLNNEKISKGSDIGEDVSNFSPLQTTRLNEIPFLGHKTWADLEREVLDGREVLK